MNIIPCPECRKLISTVSTDCPFCKASLWPIAAKVKSASAYCKGVQFVGVAIALMGLLSCLTPSATLPPTLLSLGGILFLLGRIGTFWNHH